MQIYEELVARGLIAQVTNEEEIKKLVNEGKAVFYIGFDPTADSLHVDGRQQADRITWRRHRHDRRSVRTYGYAPDADTGDDPA